MTITQPRSSYQTQPFKPFVIRSADCRELPMDQLDFIMAVPSGRMRIVVQSDDTLNLTDLLLVPDREMKSARGGSPERR